MDPSKLQSEKDNEANSLEGSDTVVENSATGTGENASNTSDASHVTDASGSTNGDAPQGQKKPPLFKRLWQKFNIYLLLFILVVLVAVGVTLGLFIKDRQVKKQTQSTISSQTLNDSTLKQLANSDVTVGNSKQILKVESNAIFAGSVLVRGDAEVAGTIKVGGEIQLPAITVSGSGRFNQLQADNLTIGNSATVQGSFIVKKGLTVTGGSSFDNLSASQIITNTFHLNGELKLTDHIAAGGPSPSPARGNAAGSGGTASVSGSDTTGSIVINTGSNTGAGCFVTITFAKHFDSTPHVVITPVGSGAAGIAYYVNRSTTDFSVCTASPAPVGQTFGFDYIVLN